MKEKSEKGFTLVELIIVVIIIGIIVSIAITKFHYRNVAQKKTISGQLESNLKTIKKMQKTLIAKKKKMLKVKKQYQKDITAMKKEIKSKKIQSYEEALHNQRVRDNLELIRQRLAYIQKLDEIMIDMSIGIESLTTLNRKVTADINFLKVADKEGSEKLVEEINRVIRDNKHFVDELVIKIDSSKIKSSQQIWNEIVRK